MFMSTIHLILRLSHADFDLVWFFDIKIYDRYTIFNVKILIKK